MIAPQTVQNGEIITTSNFSKVAIGLGTEYELQPLATESDQGKHGATKGDPKQIKTINLELINTRGLFAGQNKGDELNELSPLFSDDDMSNPIQGYSGIVEIAVEPHWDDDYLAPYIYDNYPVPAKILTLTPDYATD